MSTQKAQILAIIGQGYVGLPLAMAAVDAGWTVIGVDNFEAKVSQINSGSSPVEDISDEQLQSALTKGAYKATTDFSAVSEASVITICVPTPLDEKREPDLALLRSAATGIAPFISNETLIVSESTSYPGTLRKEIAGRITGITHLYASSPERVDPGNTQWGTKNTPRLIGGLTPEALRAFIDDDPKALDKYKKDHKDEWVTVLGSSDFTLKEDSSDWDENKNSILASLARMLGTTATS